MSVDLRGRAIATALPRIAALGNEVAIFAFNAFQLTGVPRRMKEMMRYATATEGQHAAETSQQNHNGFGG
jgi:hypothetical protein